MNLLGESNLRSIVLYAEEHLFLIALSQQWTVKLWPIVCIKRENIGCVEVWIHSVADGVVSDYFWILQSSDPEMLGEHLKTVVVALEVRDWLLVCCFHVESFDWWIYDELFVFSEATDCGDFLNFLFVEANYEMVNDWAGGIWVNVALSWIWTLEISIEGITSVEKLAYVSPNVMMKQESASRMFVHKIRHI